MIRITNFEPETSKQRLKLAAIDIGSNAIRFQITNVITYKDTHTFKRLEYVRFPLRLGQDVFKYKEIGPKNEESFFKLMHAFKLLIDLYEVDDYYACATSAMRESKNGHSIADRVNQLLGLKIHIIDGNKEAELINKVVMKSLDKDNYLHIDVGGGSTELNIISKGKKKNSKSFKIGSVRTLEASRLESTLTEITRWTQKHTKEFENIIGVGTGGNINKVFDLTGREKTDRLLSITDILDVEDYVSSFSMEDRIHQLQLNPDRADVILPAINIYLHVMKSAGCKKILVPDVGLKDGLMHMLYERNFKKLDLQFQ